MIRKIKNFLISKNIYTYYLILKKCITNPLVIFRNTYYRLKGSPDGYPIPPIKLIYLVIGDISIQSYLEGGKDIISKTIPLLEKCSIKINNFKKILDFGCGSGRLIRYLTSINNIELYGTDYNKELITWCTNNLHFAKFKLNNLYPPTDFPDNTFDFIYLRSVFTHLNENSQKEWMNEYRRLLNENGILLFTTHGDLFLDTLSEVDLKKYKSGKLVFRGNEFMGSNYSASFQSNKYVTENLLNGFRLILYVPGELNFKQDVYIAQKIS